MQTSRPLLNFPRRSPSLLLPPSTLLARPHTTTTPALTKPNPYASLSTPSLVNTLLVMSLCQFPPLVNHSTSLLALSEKLALSPIVYATIKRTFFKHFCGGETLEEVLPTMQRFKQNGIGSILDLALEADVVDHELTGAEAEAVGKRVCEMFAESVELASKTEKSFVAIKITAIIPPGLLKRWSTTLAELKNVFDSLAKDPHGRIDLKAFTTLSTTFASLTPSKAEKVFSKADKDSDGLIDWIDISNTCTPFNTSLLSLLTKPNGLTSTDVETLTLIVPHLSTLATKAQALQVRLLVDAEQTYFQPAIDSVALSLSSAYNSLGIPIIYNTYQMYLTAAYDRMMQDLARAKRGNYPLGLKVVRGAYMHSERARAQKYGYPSPIQATIADTHSAYNKTITTLAELILSDSKAPKPSVMFATHNAKSIQYATSVFPPVASTTASKQVPVSFAQLMGMQDPTTYSLASAGYAVYKYIPYGPVRVTIPYLQRRAVENVGVLKGDEVKGVWEELKRRLFGRFSVAKEIDIKRHGQVGVL